MTTFAAARPRPFRRLITASLAAIAVFMGGCGATDDLGAVIDFATYAKDIAGPLASYGKTSSRFEGDLTNASPAQLRAAATDLDAVIADLEAVTPPAKATAGHNQVISGMTKVRNGMRSLAKPGGQAQAERQINAGSRDIEQGLESIARSTGLDIDGFTVDAPE